MCKSRSNDEYQDDRLRDVHCRLLERRTDIDALREWELQGAQVAFVATRGSLASSRILRVAQDQTPPVQCYDFGASNRPSASELLRRARLQLVNRDRQIVGAENRVRMLEAALQRYVKAPPPR